MEKKDNILAWVIDDNEKRSENLLESFTHKLNLYSTRIYIDSKNVHKSNTKNNTPDNIITYKRSELKSILQNKIIELSPLFMIIITKHSNVKYSKNTRKITSLCKSLNLPILVLNSSISGHNINHIITSIDYHKKSKERVAWANYWGKKLNSIINILHPTEKDDYLIEDINANKYFAEKLFKKSGNKFTISNTNKISEDTDDICIKKTGENTDSMLIFSTTSFSLFPRIFKPKEVKLLEDCRKNPVFLIPPNHDYTIPCH